MIVLLIIFVTMANLNCIFVRTVYFTVIAMEDVRKTVLLLMIEDMKFARFLWNIFFLSKILLIFIKHQMYKWCMFVFWKINVQLFLRYEQKKEKAQEVIVRFVSIQESADATGYRADPNNCRKFYQCTEGKWIARVCPAKLYWNAEKTACDWPANDELCKNYNIINVAL